MKPGDRIPDLERAIDLTAMVAYAAATWDWHRLHYDAEHAKRAGLGGPVVDGQMLGALLAEQVLNQLGSGHHITALRYRNRAPVYAGALVVCEATVAEVAHNHIAFDQIVRVGDEVVVAPASTSATLGS